MNERRVVSRRIPYIPVTISVEAFSLPLETEALVNTGYTGFVVVPAQAYSIALAPTHRVTLRLADGSPVTAAAFRGAPRVGGSRLMPILITELGNATIIGLEVLQHFTLTLDHGRVMTIEP